jgi:hypothetical protein
MVPSTIEVYDYVSEEEAAIAVSYGCDFCSIRALDLQIHIWKPDYLIPDKQKSLFVPLRGHE